MQADQLRVLADRGIIVPEFSEMLPEDWRSNPQAALDALPALITSPNFGIPAFLANLVDPTGIRVLMTPMKATMICEEVKKGDWTTISAQFRMVESTGEVASYNDYSNDGQTGSNYQWEPRQSYHYQTITQYGDREAEMWGLASINYVSDLNYSATLIMNKFQNQTYLYGVGGANVNFANYGLLNDPALLAPITPSTKIAGGTTWAVAQAQEIYNDVLALFVQAQTQMQGLIDRETAMTLVMSPTVEPQMGKVTSYTLASVRKAINDNFPNTKIVTVPEYATAGGQLAQLWVDSVDGERTGWVAFTEKLRAGRVVADMSSYKQKRIGGSWGSVIRRPVAVAQMLGL